MEEDEEYLFKKLMQESQPDQTCSDFTDSVMKMVQAEELARQEVLRTLLVKADADHPSFMFESRIMSQILPAAEKVEKPIISNGAWYTIAAFFALVIGYSIFAKSPQLATDVDPYLLGRTLTVFSVNISEIPSIYSIVIIAFCILLMADYFILQRFPRRTVH
ncbi:hypothetical protein [Dyadobacter sp. CY356]|uniref:hypothetical protein n=1 Tax=Dyadobacter sp. CY356 TaxID=2906442 RepID=UPI001F3887A5|nr:hypothetical protein [Dyadobacter sp. CY356]MCF0056231.1 hypothetical protein [Dyadobacter sp. CY356]